MVLQLKEQKKFLTCVNSITAIGYSGVNNRVTIFFPRTLAVES